MAYTLKLTNGKILLNLSDQKTDQLTTSLTLIGKNVSAYGSYYNENFIQLLENFANKDEPRSPLVGQLWYNTAQGRMFAYTANNQFRPVGGPIVSATTPNNVVSGDLWLDTVNKQLNVYNGTEFITAGPLYSEAQGKAGWVVEEILGNDVQTYTVSSLYNNGVLLAVLSEKSFVPATSYQGITSVGVGLTLNSSLSGNQITGTASNASAIQGITTSSFVRNTGAQHIFTDPVTTTPGSLFVDTNVTIGPDQNIQFYVDNTDDDASVFWSRKVDKFLKIKINGSPLNGTRTAIAIDPSGNIGIWNSTPGTTPNNSVEPKKSMDINADTTIRGNLTVIGNSTNVDVNDLRVEDINIELAYPAGSLSDGQIDGGGIILHGTNDHSITYKQSIGWHSNENWNLAPNKSYYIDEVRVLDATSLYVTSAPSLTSIGTLNELNAGNISISTSTISTIDNSDLALAKFGLGNISACGKPVNDLAPITLSSSSTTAVTKYYVDNIQALKNANMFVFSLDVTGVADVNLYVINYLDRMLPIGNPGDFYYIPDQARARVNLMVYTVPSWQVTGNNNYATETVDKNNNPSSVSVITSFVVTVNSPVTEVSCTQEIRQYIVAGGQWNYDQIIP